MTTLDILKTQILLKRTTKAWPISNNSMILLEETYRKYHNYPIGTMVCENCGIILGEDHFGTGCPNCNSPSFRKI